MVCGTSGRGICVLMTMPSVVCPVLSCKCGNSESATVSCRSGYNVFRKLLVIGISYAWIPDPGWSSGITWGNFENADLNPTWTQWIRSSWGGTWDPIFQSVPGETPVWRRALEQVANLDRSSGSLPLLLCPGDRGESWTSHPLWGCDDCDGTTLGRWWRRCLVAANCEEGYVGMMVSSRVIWCGCAGKPGEWTD